MRKRYPNIIRVLMVLVMAVALTGVLAAVPAGAQSCSNVSLSATSGPVGTAITVSVTGASGWNGQPVTVTFDGAAMTTSPASVTVDTGAASAQVQIPATIAGAHSISVMVGYTPCSFTFTVTPALTISPTTGPAGTPVTVTGSGFGASVPVTVQVSLGGSVIASGVSVNADGSFTAAGSVPSGLTAGAQDVSAVDGAANTATKTGGFTVTPSISVSPSSGLAGSAVTVSGTGWGTGTIDITFAGNSWLTGISPTAGSFSVASVATLTTTPSGGMAIVGTQGANTAATTFTVMPRALTLTPDTGPKGVSVTVTASSLSPGSQVSANNMTFGTTAWNPSDIQITTGGALTPTTLTVPASAATGANTVLLVDDVGLSASGIYTVTKPTTTISPATGPAGSSVTVTGSGWVPNQAVMLNFAGAPMTVYADANGNIAAAMVVPQVAAGQYSLTASDTLGNSALDAAFVVPGAAITVSPTSGAIGTEMTISGTGFQGYSGITIMIGSYQYPITPLTSPLGTFDVTITVPGVAPMAQVITVTDGASNQATAFFVVTAAAETVETALSGISDVLEIVWDYAGGDWLFYDPADPEGSDLDGLVKGVGYWLKVTADATLIYGGNSYALMTGWNNLGWLGA